MTSPELPHDIADERATLASILINRDAIAPIAPWLEPAHFYLDVHGLIYAAMLACFKARTTPSLVNLSAMLRTTGQFDAVGGMDRLLSITDTMIISTDVEIYARRVVNYAVLRQGISASSTINGLFYAPNGDGEHALASAINLLSSIKISSADAVFQPISTAVDHYYDKLARVLNGEQSVLGMMTGYRDLDELTGGLHTDELTLIAARPSVGKTALMLSLAYNIAQRHEVDVLICSLEMSTEQLMQRLLAMATRIDTHRLRTIHLNPDEQQRVMDALPIVAAFPVYIADISAMTVEQIRLATIRHRSTHERPILPIVDYLQLMGSTRARENRVQDVSEISRSMKSLSRELHVPLIALSQLSRAVESRQSHVPMLSDLRESGSLEQDADNVWFIYRDELYSEESDQKGIAEIHIAKARNGPIGVVPLRFDAATTRFDDLTFREVEGY